MLRDLDSKTIDPVKEVEELKQMLIDKSHSEYLLKDYDAQNIPFDGLFLYTKEIWKAIEQNKDINIPNHKVVVSSFRCNEIKNDSMLQSEEDFVNLRREIYRNPRIDLRQSYNQIF